MKAVLLGGVAILALAAVGPARAADAKAAVCDPYKNYNCLDAYLGQDIWTRLVNYYKLEWGQAGPPADPKALPGRRAYWPVTPGTVPPLPFTEWPYGGSTVLGVSRTGAVDSPLMVALAKTDVGEFLNDHGLQVYGWFDAGFNISSNRTFNGNSPAAYMSNPNSMQLDQAVLYFERVPDTVQKDHIDWGFRLSGLYGENYRYTEAYGLWSYQFQGRNLQNGFDTPMMYGELFFPQLLEGTLVRVGRFISLPDIEAQLAPNNYMYSHSLTYGWDNYTNTGIQVTQALNKNLFVQVGLTVGTEAMPWHWGQTTPNLAFPNNPLFPNSSYPLDPGSVPSLTACLRYQTNSGNDNLYVCEDALNNGLQGYNNLQWTGFTYYHRFNEQWHISSEFYTLSQNDVLNLNNPTVFNTLLPNGITPLAGANIVAQQPNFAYCSNPNLLTCTSRSYTALTYLNYSPNPLDNWSFRAEYYVDQEGQRISIPTRYIDLAIGLQHWLSPQIEFRPEVAYYHSFNTPAFDGVFNPLSSSTFTCSTPVQGTIPASCKNYSIVGSADMIFHF
ncbi:MAG: outer membrane beta-barrel protein [Xanthobacteraceae bacterium]